MPSDRTDDVLLDEMQESAGRIVEYTASLVFEAFRADPMVRDAVCMRLIVIGEAANRLSDETKSGLPRLDWDGMAGLRHLLAHDYGSASPTLLWSIVTVSVPDLMAALAGRGQG